jgi:hypothetical protein
MPQYEYKVIPAPRRGEKSREARTTEDRFALALTSLMNQLGREGWDYVRADVLPCDERSGLTGTKTTYQTMMVFRRALDPAPVAEGTAAPNAFTLLKTPAAVETPKLGPAIAAPEGPAPTLGPAVERGQAD